MAISSKHQEICDEPNAVTMAVFEEARSANLGDIVSVETSSIHSKFKSADLKHLS